MRRTRESKEPCEPSTTDDPDHAVSSRFGVWEYTHDTLLYRYRQVQAVAPLSRVVYLTVTRVARGRDSRQARTVQVLPPKVWRGVSRLPTPT